MIIVEYICTTNDRNGNPRRGWKIHRARSTGTTYLGYVDEGYAGDHRLTVALAQWATHRGMDLAVEGVAILPRVNVAPGYWQSEYRGRQFTTGDNAEA